MGTFASIAELNLLISNPWDLRVAFDLMEGDGFYDKSRNGPSEDCMHATNLKTAFDWLTKQGHWSDYEEDEKLTGYVIVYGRDGGHRYFVRPGGRIDYGVMFGLHREADDADALGFNLFPK